MNKSVERIGKQASAEEMRDQFESLFITTAEKAATVILKGVKSNQRRILIGPDAKLLDVMARALPASYQTLVEKSLAFTAR